MIIKLAYGKNGLDINLNDRLDVTVIEPVYIKGLKNPEKKLVQALREPIGSSALREIIRPSDKIGIVFNDITRPTPYRTILPVILKEVGALPKENVTLFNALGTHRENSREEMEAFLGKEVVSQYRIIQNNAFDPSTQVSIGRSFLGHEIWVNRAFFECDLKILTGYIEPHFFAGFSGGGKAVMPGMGGISTIMANHGADMIDHPNATWGVTFGNPIWEEIREIGLKVGKTFLVNVSLNRDKEITGIFTGDLSAAHNMGCDVVKKLSMVPVKKPFDIVITSNAGYPLDLNLYQSVKGMSAAAQIVREGGAIIVVAECWDGIPDHGSYGKILMEAENVNDLVEVIHKPNFYCQDQWQVQIQAQIMRKAKVYVYSENLSEEQIESAMLRPSIGVEQTVDTLLAEYGSKASICVLIEGPQTIPYVK